MTEGWFVEAARAGEWGSGNGEGHFCLRLYLYPLSSSTEFHVDHHTQTLPSRAGELRVP